MNTTKNIHPVYFNSFVGIWKCTKINGSPSNGFIKFNEDCTFEDDGSFNPFEGTVNGDVDEIAVEDDGHEHDRKRRKGKSPMPKLIKGVAVLTKDSKTQKWAYRIGKGRDIGIKNDGLILELQCNDFRAIYVGNLPSAEGKPKKSFKKKVKV